MDPVNDPLDADLRNFSVPPDLAAQLARLATWPDEELDRELKNVAVPAALKSRLQLLPDDFRQDEVIRDVPLPAKLAIAIRRIPKEDRRWQTHTLNAIAASWLVTITVGYTLLVWQLLSRASTPTSSGPTLVFMQVPPIELEAGAMEEEVQLSSEAAVVLMEDEPPSDDALGPWPPAERDVLPQYPVEEVWQIAQKTHINRPIYNRDILGATPILRTNELPPLERIVLPEARGIATPLVPGYDRGFLLRTGVHPPISPRHPVLRQSLAPLSVVTDTFDAVAMAAQKQKAPVASEVRTEDFVAAIKQGVPAPAAGQLALEVAGSRSKYGPEGTRLVSLAVKAGQPLRRVRPSTHLVVACDFSEWMVSAGHWLWVREALAEMVERLGPDDRLSLVFFQDEVLMGTMPLDASAADKLRRSLGGAIPFGEADPLVGLESALDVAIAAETPAKHTEIVLLTAGQFDLTQRHRKRVQSLAEEAKRYGVRLELIGLNGDRQVAHGISTMAKALGVAERGIGSRRKLVQALQKQLTGDEAIAAAEVKLLLHFNPEVVAAYRLIGHEANTMAQLVTPATVAELRGGEEAVVLFELLPQASSNVDSIAKVELTWNAGSGTSPQSMVRSIAPSELDQPWEATSLAFRSTALAAETAEQLRGSRTALQSIWKSREPATFAGLRSELKTLSSSSSQSGNSSLQSLISVIEAADEQRGR